jgi:shikimate kinase
MSVPGSRRFRNILVVGLPGVGKSTFARAYAQMSRTEFVELDRYVERLAGKSIAEIFAQDGEAAFREFESQCLERLMKRQRCTIALGGGTLTHLPSLKMAQELGCLVLLTAPVEVISRRLWPQKDERPLLAGCQTPEELTETLKSLWQQREESYLKADLILDASHSSVDTLKIELDWLEQNLLAAPGALTSLDTSSFLKRSVPLADADYRSPREQRSGREITDKMERFLKVQRQKERGEKRDKRDRKNQQPRRSELQNPQQPPSQQKRRAEEPPLTPNGQRDQARPQRGNERSSRENRGAPGESRPMPRVPSPSPREVGPAPREAAPSPREAGPTPREVGPTPREVGPTPREGGPTPREGGPTPRADRGPKSRDTAPRARDSGPMPREANPATRNEPKPE